MGGTTLKGTQYTTTPDYRFVSNGGLVEVKAGRNISYSPQLQTQVNIGERIGVPSRIIVGPNSRVYQPALDNYGRGNVLRFDPATGKFTKY